MKQKTKSEESIISNSDIPMTAEIKAFLLSVGTADIENSEMILPTSKSTAGPSAGGSGSVFIYSNGRRVRLNIDKNSPLKIKKISKNGSQTKIAVINSETNQLIVTGENEPILAHCPRQAYINLSEKCIYNCKYCSVPKLQGRVKTKEESLEIIKAAFEKGEMEAISITSGVESTPEGELNRVLDLLPDLLNYGVPIGVSIYAVSEGSKKLKAAGVSEVKYNIEVADSEIFEKVCPGLSTDEIFKELTEAVHVFGKGRVYSNLIVGLGETDENVERMIEKLAEIGVISCVRPIYQNPYRKDECFMERPSQERLLKLFEMQKKISQKYDLHPEESETMCSLCTGCDMVPFRDG